MDGSTGTPPEAGGSILRQASTQEPGKKRTRGFRRSYAGQAKGFGSLEAGSYLARALISTSTRRFC